LASGAHYLGLAGDFSPAPLLILTNAPGGSCAELAEAAAFAQRHYRCAGGRCRIASGPDPATRLTRPR
jgi:hypothetical protein